MTIEELITQALDDMRDRYDVARLAYWMGKIGEAAKNRLEKDRGEFRLETALRKQMAKHIGKIERVTLDSVMPQLHEELSYRMAVSRDLIVLNREKAMLDMQQRFAGWDITQKSGGKIDLKTAKANIVKPLSQYTYEENRLVNDQGHKFLNSLNTITSIGGGAIIGTWRSRWRAVNYDYRDAHKALDGRVFVARNSWALEQGLIKKTGKYQYIDEVEQPSVPVNCRCSWEFSSSLRDVPRDMLTEKGMALLSP